jgi:hypothetical protein
MRWRMSPSAWFSNAATPNDVHKTPDSHGTRWPCRPTACRSMSNESQVQGNWAVFADVPAPDRPRASGSGPALSGCQQCLPGIRSEVRTGSALLCQVGQVAAGLNASLVVLEPTGDAPGVRGEQHGHAVAGPLRDLGRRDPVVQPRRQAGVAQVVYALAEGRGELLWSEGLQPCGPPCPTEDEPASMSPFSPETAGHRTSAARRRCARAGSSSGQDGTVGGVPATAHLCRVARPAAALSSISGRADFALPQAPELLSGRARVAESGAVGDLFALFPGAVVVVARPPAPSTPGSPGRSAAGPCHRRGGSGWAGPPAPGALFTTNCPTSRPSASC